MLIHDNLIKFNIICFTCFTFFHFFLIYRFTFMFKPVARIGAPAAGSPEAQA